MRLLSYDFLIVGQGLAGSILAYELKKSGKKVLVIDRYNPFASSRVAAGLVNPITGRRVVKSWMAETLIPFAHDYYRQLEKDLGESFYTHIDSLEVITGVKELNDWTERMDDPSIRQYFKNTTVDSSLYENKIKDFKKLIRISASGWMNIPRFLELFREKLREDHSLLEETFDIQQLEVTADKIQYGLIEATKIIFCEGFQSTNNAYWKFIPFVPAKGEILTIRCEQLPQEYILLAGIFLIPLGNGLFRTGSTYEWNFTDDLPSEKGKSKLITELNAFLKVPYEIVHHHAGIRPTMKDRRPVIGAHPHHPNMYIFNGMGTKGVLLIPYFADCFINFIEKNISLPEEVQLNRFLHLL